MRSNQACLFIKRWNRIYHDTVTADLKQPGALWRPLYRHHSGRYLHGGVDGGVRSQAEVGAGDVVADGSRDDTHGDAELVEAAPRLKQLQHALVGLGVNKVQPLLLLLLLLLLYSTPKSIICHPLC